MGLVFEVNTSTVCHIVDVEISVVSSCLRIYLFDLISIIDFSGLPTVVTSTASDFMICHYGKVKII